MEQLEQNSQRDIFLPLFVIWV